LGPGYGPQYAWWYIPALLAGYPLLDDGWRRILTAFYVIAAATYVVEYAFVRALGAYALAFARGSPFLERASGRLSTPGAQTIERIPLFVAFLVVLVAGLRRLDLVRVQVPPA